MPLPDSHQAHQGPARTVDLGPGTLHVTPLFTGLKVFPPTSICHLLGQKEVAGLRHFCTSSPVESKTRHLRPHVLGGSKASISYSVTGCLWVMGEACRGEWTQMHMSHRANGHREKYSAATDTGRMTVGTWKQTQDPWVASCLV